MHALIVLNSLSPPLRLALGIPIKIARSTQPPYDTKRFLRRRLSSITDSSLVLSINLHVYETILN